MRPLRTCIACNARKPQHELLRFRRRSDGRVLPAPDPHAGAGSGRSAYVCPRGDCITRVNSARMSRAFRARSSIASGTDGSTQLWREMADRMEDRLAVLQRSKGQALPGDREAALASRLMALYSASDTTPIRGIRDGNDGRNHGGS